MQFALINSQRHPPQPKLRGTCPCCAQETISKCGTRILWHWAHHGRRHCDPWWDNETEWHRAWKAQFPEAMREVVHFDEATGEKHVADIKTDAGLVIELQHSAMPPNELQSREKFYGRMIWILDGSSFASQFDVSKYPLPHPESMLLNDVVFYQQADGSAFWRLSERSASSQLVPFRPASEIGDEIMADYRGHHFFQWTRPRTVWMTATMPVFVDFGGDELFQLLRYGRFGHWCVQRTPTRDLVENNGGIYSGRSAVTL